MKECSCSKHYESELSLAFLLLEISYICSAGDVGLTFFVSFVFRFVVPYVVPITRNDTPHTPVHPKKMWSISRGADKEDNTWSTKSVSVHIYGLHGHVRLYIKPQVHLHIRLPM